MGKSKLFVVDFRNDAQVEAKILDCIGVVSAGRPDSDGRIVTKVSASNGRTYDVDYSSTQAYNHDNRYDYMTLAYNVPTSDNYADMSMEAYFKCFLYQVAGSMGPYVYPNKDVFRRHGKPAINNIEVIRDRYFSLCDLIQTKASKDRFIFMRIYPVWKVDGVICCRSSIDAVEPDYVSKDGSWVIFKSYEFKSPEDDEVIKVQSCDNEIAFVMRATNNVMEDCMIANHMIDIIREEHVRIAMIFDTYWNITGTDMLYMEEDQRNYLG